MAMRIPNTDYQMDRPNPGVTEKEFDSRANLKEGIVGSDRFDSRFENTERTQVLAPRGDARGRPMPRDARFRNADNHGEWGPDKFVEPLELGMDGPDSNASYRGAGLPTRYDLSYPVDPAACVGIGGMAPTGDGVEGDI